jgi:energy-coupling factor transport system ATP-binding protein
MGIELREVGFTYLPGTPMAREVLSGIDIELREGEILCLMGRTGAGKSTLIHVMSGLLDATRGEIVLDKVRAEDSRTGSRALRNAVGILLQSSSRQLFAETVERDVAFGPRNLGLSGEELTRRVHEAMTAAGLDPGLYGKRSPFSLSEGEMRRAAMAGVLAMKPRYLLLDEPSSGLDLPGREHLYEVMKRLREEGVGILLITHDWEEVESLADRTALLSRGRIPLQGGRETLMTAIDELEEAGLRPHPLVEVLAELRRRGLDLPLYAPSPADAAVLIAAAIEGR